MMRDTLEIQTRVTQEQAAEIAELKAEIKRLNDKLESEYQAGWYWVTYKRARQVVELEVDNDNFKAWNGDSWEWTYLTDCKEVSRVVDPLEAKYDE